MRFYELGRASHALAAEFVDDGRRLRLGRRLRFNSKLRDELLNGELFYSLAEARIVIESGRQQYNTQRPHSSLAYKPPAVLWPAGTTSTIVAKPTMH